jgi:multidrug resistance protein, MATE family
MGAPLSVYIPIETITNILLDYGLIFGHWGLTGLGFNGAAYASVVAEAAGMLVVFAVINSQGISRSLQLYQHFKFDPALARLILSQSAPLIFQFAISIITWEYFYILIEHHGQQELAISNTMRNIFGIFGAFTWAFASTTNAMVSNVIGQGKKDQVIALIKKIVKLSMSIACVVALLLNLFPATFLSIYGQSQEFVRAAIPVIRVVSAALILMSFATVWLNAVTGTGNSKINLGIELVTIFFYCIYVYLILGYWNLPILYGWMSEWIYWIITFSLSFAYMRSEHWKKKVI